LFINSFFKTSNVALENVASSNIYIKNYVFEKIKQQLIEMQKSRWCSVPLKLAVYYQNFIGNNKCWIG
jgi:hypothetical protein